ncbi:NADPH-dependent FMN reductase, partial [Vibrio parahaemolyticus]|nr:NADPH-dependent FMN reductase [Vibrio parahaemolyticus]
PSFYENFDVESGKVVNPEVAEQVKQAVALLK